MIHTITYKQNILYTVDGTLGTFPTNTWIRLSVYALHKFPELKAIEQSVPDRLEEKRLLYLKS